MFHSKRVLHEEGISADGNPFGVLNGEWMLCTGSNM